MRENNFSLSDFERYKYLIVQKSYPLYALANSPFTLEDFKLLDIYASKIDSHKPDECTVVISLEEIESILGVSRIKIDSLTSRLDRLITPITIIDEENKKVKLSFFEAYQISKSEVDNNVYIALTCGQTAKKYFFNVEKLGYLRMLLVSLCHFESRYSYFLYLNLLKVYNTMRNKGIKTPKVKWIHSIDKIKEYIGCTAKRYDDFKYFNRDIIKKCVEDINLKTELHISYTPVREGRFYTKIEFSVEDNKENFDFFNSSANAVGAEDVHMMSDEAKVGSFECIAKGNTYEDYLEPEDIDYGCELCYLLGDAGCNNEFTPEQIRVIADLLLITPYKNSHIDMCNYLLRKVHVMNEFEKNTKISNRFAFLQSIIKKDIENNSFV